MRATTTEQFTMDYLRFVLVGTLMIEYMDALKGTQAYKQRDKMLINRLQESLVERIEPQYDKVHSTDEEMTSNIMRSLEEFMEKIVVSITDASIDDLVMINAVINKYNGNKEWFKEYGSAEFLKLD